MPSNKPKKHFLVAADERGDFYRAYTENKARKVAEEEGKELYYMHAPLGAMKWHYDSFDNATLLLETMGQSALLRDEFIDNFVDQLHANPEKRSEIVDIMREKEKDIRLANLTLDAEEALFDKYGDQYEKVLTYRQLHDMPQTDFNEKPSSFYSIDVETVTAITESLEAIDYAFNGTENVDQAKADVKRILNTSAFDENILIRLATEAGVGFGDRDYDDDYGQFCGGPDYGESYFDVRDAVIRHWGDLNTREKASGEGLMQTFAFAVGQRGKAAQAVYVQGDFVREYGRKLEL